MISENEKAVKKILILKKEFFFIKVRFKKLLKYINLSIITFARQYIPIRIFIALSYIIFPSKYKIIKIDL